MATTEFPASETSQSTERLRDLIQQAGSILPIAGPITNFVFLNTLQAMEDLPFHEGILKGARLFNSQPYLSEKGYREKIAKGRIRLEDLAWVLKLELGNTCNEPVCPLATKLQFRLAMLQFPLLLGPTMELRWFVAQTDALRTLRPEVIQSHRDRFIAETKRWVMRDLREAQPDRSGGKSSNAIDVRGLHLLKDLLLNFGESSIEYWSPEKWEAFSLQTLWRLCRQGVHGIDFSQNSEPQSVRLRDSLLRVTGEDTDLLVNDILIRYCAAFLDQGQASWQLPNRDLGFFRAFQELYGRSSGLEDQWLRGLARELNRIKRAEMTPLESIADSLNTLGVRAEDHEQYITESVLALRGWTAMIRHMEDRADRFPYPAPQGTLIEYVAVRLILERLAIAYVAREELDFGQDLADLKATLRDKDNSAPQKLTSDHIAFLFFQLAQVLGWTPPDVFRMTRQDWAGLVAEIEAFPTMERRRIFHLAFERRFRAQALDAVTVVAKRKTQRVRNPTFQSVYCIDAREESFRRHLEETDPQAETFAAAGFYSIPIYYKGVTDAHFAALCPIVVRPQHWLTEDVVYTFSDVHERRAKTRRALGAASHQIHVRSRTFAWGALLTAGLGVLASIPLVARVLFPRATARLRRTAGRLVEAPRITRLRIERSTSQPGSEHSEVGFTADEMANFGERVLRDIGLTSGFSRLVIFHGHGSFCLNNPHKSAYDCGACSGAAGGPNARALAMMLNDPRVRETLYRRGLNIPRDTVFLGALHNTCNDTIKFYDLDLLPQSHLHDFEDARRTLDEACRRNAHERCRRFYSAPLDLSPEAARLHTEERSEDLAQTRPEFGNATNALCYVGRRHRIQGLYLDRRAFMHSYDASQDDDVQTILSRILGAVVPVCEGINLTYYFSYVDPTGWGSGTKLPHNVTSLIGVMNGPSSDLQIGLPLQGVEIHEPVRLLFIIEAAPEAMLAIMDRNPLVGKIIRNGWVQLTVLDPHSSRIQVFRQGKFVDYKPEQTDLPHADSSLDWYRGWRDHLGFSLIEPNRPNSGSQG